MLEIPSFGGSVSSNCGGVESCIQKVHAEVDRRIGLSFSKIDPKILVLRAGKMMIVILWCEQRTKDVVRRQQREALLFGNSYHTFQCYL